MPNWAITYYEIHGDEKALKDLEKHLNDLRADSGIKSDFNADWLGHVAYNIYRADMDEEEAKKATLHGTSMRCRGCFTSDIENMGDKLVFQTESAWINPENLFEKAVELSGLDDECQVYWLSMELGNGYFETNDTNRVAFDEDYFIDHEGHEALVDLIGGSEFYTIDQIESILIKLVTSEFIDKDVRLSKDESTKLSVDELFELTSDAEYHTPDGKEIFLRVYSVR